jgi:hypothetical protein
VALKEKIVSVCPPPGTAPLARDKLDDLVEQPHRRAVR